MSTHKLTMRGGKLALAKVKPPVIKRGKWHKTTIKGVVYSRKVIEINPS